MFTILYKGYPICGYCDSDTCRVHLPDGYYYRKGIKAAKALITKYVNSRI